MDTSEIYYNMCAKAFPEDAKEGNAFKTQDQLQEMLGEKYPRLKDLLYRFAIWAMFHVQKFASMEQLWLAFVMKELFEKVWSNDKWIKESA